MSRKKMSRKRQYIIIIRVTSELGAVPNIRTLCGDTLFLTLGEGMTARYSTKKVPTKKKG